MRQGFVRVTEADAGFGHELAFRHFDYRTAYVVFSSPKIWESVTLSALAMTIRVDTGGDFSEFSTLDR